MIESEVFVSEQIKKLVPQYEKVELKAMVSSIGFTIEFFATVDGETMQCFDMMDRGLFSQKNFNVVSKAIANYFRGVSDFNPEGLNNYTVILE